MCCFKLDPVGLVPELCVRSFENGVLSSGCLAGFDAFEIDHFVDSDFHIAEILRDRTCVLTKSSGTGGMVTVDTCKCHLFYKLQGDVHLNSNVKAYLD